MASYSVVLHKVHGGTTEEAVKHKVESSLKLARENKRKFRDVDTVLFFDEANTTGRCLICIYYNEDKFPCTFLS